MIWQRVVEMDSLRMMSSEIIPLALLLWLVLAVKKLERNVNLVVGRCPAFTVGEKELLKTSPSLELLPGCPIFESSERKAGIERPDVTGAKEGARSS